WDLCWVIQPAGSWFWFWSWSRSPVHRYSEEEEEQEEEEEEEEEESTTLKPPTLIWTLVERVSVWTVLICYLSTASCQSEDVRGFLSDDVLLPCVHGDVRNVPDKVNVFWRDKDNKIVLNIEDSIEHTEFQNPRFKDRVSSFPEKYKKGNFSIVMKDLKPEDEGVYWCHILDVEEKSINVKVLGERVEEPRTVSPTEPGSERGSERGSGRGSAVTDSRLLVLLSAPLVMLLFNLH
ncbi:uncharacterized protein LOC125001242, partial [Mugil cephalus]|uniref:uncharacterized protein LOC125001242 n=1 Tax=Mugil cephalus TaxID=48193 RepID=UPI001FB7F999